MSYSLRPHVKNTHLESIHDAPRIEEDTFSSILVRPGKDIVGGGSDSSQREVLLRIHVVCGVRNEVRRCSEKELTVHPRFYS